jgi:23S rRNA (cytidine1920-2'-O)/16S rRNA (cytidine1409-2'-O)-methyltransferase
MGTFSDLLYPHPMKGIRLDVLVFRKGLAQSREQAQAFILAGEVWRGEERLDKPGHKVDPDDPIEVRSRTPAFASRGGHKLAHALEHFRVPVAGRVAMDVGASTGGFADCLLKAGARHVFCVDVGYGQLEQRLREDARVTNVEKTNARYLIREALVKRNELAEAISLVTIDVSFISLKTVVPPLAREFPAARDWILLFKPQFEVGRRYIGKGGLVSDETRVGETLVEFHKVLLNAGLRLKGTPESSPLPGKKSGNVEYLIHYEIPPNP